MVQFTHTSHTTIVHILHTKRTVHNYHIYIYKKHKIELSTTHKTDIHIICSRTAQYAHAHQTNNKEKHTHAKSYIAT